VVAAADAAPSLSANAGRPASDELMSAGLRLDAGKEEALARGDFTALLFVLEAE
jgi:hypothetical protein